MTDDATLSAALECHLPSPIGHCESSSPLAIDLHLLPYYGQPNEAEVPYIYRSQAKAGTTSFFAYATVYVIRAHRRVTLAIHAVQRGETMVVIITCLLDQEIVKSGVWLGSRRRAASGSKWCCHQSGIHL